jgi:transcription antitermination factor NusG
MKGEPALFANSKKSSEAMQAKVLTKDEAHCNFCRIHTSLRVTPAMAAGVTDKVWDIADLVAMIKAMEPAPAKRGPYQKADGRMKKHHQGLEGRIVQVIDGPFTGFRGEVKEVDDRTVRVDVQTFGRATSVDLVLGQLELVPN